MAESLDQLYGGKKIQPPQPGSIRASSPEPSAPCAAPLSSHSGSPLNRNDVRFSESCLTR